MLRDSCHVDDENSCIDNFAANLSRVNIGLWRSDFRLGMYFIILPRLGRLDFHVPSFLPTDCERINQTVYQLTILPRFGRTRDTQRDCDRKSRHAAR